MRWSHAATSRVSIHAPAWGATRRARQPHERFNPRPRVGGDCAASTGLPKVSIHAPAWGATARVSASAATRVSIHAPAWGATMPDRDPVASSVSIHAPRAGGDGWASVCRALIGFNPRPRAGGDLIDLARVAIDGVSIHAPARGATRRPLSVGSDRWFQSTPPRGGRRDRSRAACAYAGFNPRPRAGGDHRRRCTITIDRRVSIHAPARGATSMRAAPTSASSMFQSTPPRGGRPSASSDSH